MKGEKKYKEAREILDKFYKHDYILNGIQYTEKELYNIYLKHLRKAAYAAFPEAQYDLAQNYEDQNYWLKNPNYSPSKCVYWYTKATEQDYPAAFNNLAGFYETGEGVKQDIQKALELYKRAGELGDPYGNKNYKILLKQIKEGKYRL